MYLEIICFDIKRESERAPDNLHNLRLNQCRLSFLPFHLLLILCMLYCAFFIYFYLSLLTSLTFILLFSAVAASITHLLHNTKCMSWRSRTHSLPEQPPFHSVLLQHSAWCTVCIVCTINKQHRCGDIALL